MSFAHTEGVARTVCNTTDDRSRARADEPTGDHAWPPVLPHPQIDELIDRLAAGRSVDPAEAYELLGLVAREAQRLRAMVVRLSAAKLAEADREATAIVTEALDQADSMRSVGLSLLTTRLDEADRVLSAVREAYRAETAGAETAGAEPAGAEPDVADQHVDLLADSEAEPI